MIGHFLFSGKLSWILPFPAAALLGWALTFVTRAIAIRFSIFARPNARRRHPKLTPLLGGLTVYLVIAPILTAIWVLVPSDGGHDGSVAALLIASSLVFATGVLDDFLEIRAGHKFFGQFVAAMLILVTEPNLPVIFENYQVPHWLGYPLSFVWIVGLTNAYNLIDGLDGLCAGLATISGLALAAMLPPGPAQIMALSVAGTAAGFLVHNFNPARIFLGDSGSLLLGFMLGALSFKIQLSGPLAPAAALMVFAFSVPILDTSLAIIRRTRLSRSVFAGDRGHLHHRLQHLGMSVRKTAVSLYLLHAYFGLSAWTIWRGSPEWGWMAFVTALPVLFIVVKGLKFTEHLLSYQSARLSYSFLSDELDALSDLEPARQVVSDQMRHYEQTQEPFSVVLIDCSAYIQQIVHAHPTRIVNFYVSLYGTIKARLRKTDLIVRPTELVFAIILPKTWDHEGEHAKIFDFLRKELKSLQEAHGIFQGDPLHPEGYKLLVYPKDRARILRAVDFSEQGLVSSPRKDLGRTRRKAA
ncbi:MAG: undecaprenyl/decaprenyl-phosphate alpha-N-acetylglucosaminyl 1-phosphate transferase [Oligoflexia bacterium]|nr:undecaprenyl/decaprenyl-phosphate alpha-N-acetylglucosaminyl 1-phosphate transferase [Oligoflexia bacterium]